MIPEAQLKLLISFWYTAAFMRWMMCGEQGIEQAMEFAVANETNVTNLNWRELSRVWLPQGVAESGMRKCELIAKSVIVCPRACHCEIASEYQ